jgi:non-ribosomal peptide synthetase component F
MITFHFFKAYLSRLHYDYLIYTILSNLSCHVQILNNLMFFFQIMILKLVRRKLEAYKFIILILIAKIKHYFRIISQTEGIIRKVDDKLSYVSTTCRVNFLHLTFGEQLFKIAEQHPNHIAYIFHRNNGLKMTYADAKDRAVRLAQNWLTMGLKKGDRVATLLPNTYELIVCYLAAALNGLIIVPLDQDYGSAELEYMIQKTEPSAIIVYNSEEFEATVNELFPNINSFEKGEYVNEKFPGLRHLVFLNPFNENSKNVWTWAEIADRLLNKGPAHEFPLVNPDDDYTIIFTSGTTGRPKGFLSSKF